MPSMIRYGCPSGGPPPRRLASLGYGPTRTAAQRLTMGRVRATLDDRVVRALRRMVAGGSTAAAAARALGVPYQKAFRAVRADTYRWLA
jgi:hypothetical protein